MNDAPNRSPLVDVTSGLVSRPWLDWLGSVATAAATAQQSAIPAVWPSDRGGTGLASFAAGDLLVATSTTELSRLPVGPTNTVLLASGQPTWGFVADASITDMNAAKLSGTVSDLRLSTNVALYDRTGNFEDGLYAFLGSPSFDFESSLQGSVSNASHRGPALALGQLGDTSAWAVSADYLTVGRRALRFIALAESTAKRYAMTLTQASAISASDGDYFLVGGPNGGTLTLGGDPLKGFGALDQIQGLFGVNVTLSGQLSIQTGNTTGRALIAQGVSTKVNHYLNSLPAVGPQFAFVSQCYGSDATGSSSYKVAGYFAGESGSLTDPVSHLGDDVIPLNAVVQWDLGDPRANYLGIEIDVANNAQDVGLNDTPWVNGLVIASGGTFHPKSAMLIGATTTGNRWRRGIEIPDGTVQQCGIECGSAQPGFECAIFSKQFANNADDLVLSRFTDAASTGYFLRCINRANTSTLFAIDVAGTVYAYAGDIEVGSPTASGTPFIDFHSSGNNIDYDARIIASGGSGTVGRGTLQLFAGNATLTNSAVVVNSNGSEVFSILANGKMQYGTVTPVSLADFVFVIRNASASGSGLAVYGGSSSSNVALQVVDGAAATFLMVVFGDGGVTVGNAPTGSSKGAGTINVSTNIFKNGTAYNNPHFVFEHAYTGAIVKYRDRLEAMGLEDYRRLDLDELREYTRVHHHFPGFEDEAGLGLFDGGERLLLVTEELALHLFDLDRRLSAVEGVCQ